MSYYIASMYSSTGSSDYTCVWIDINGYTMSGTAFTDRNWATATGFMYVGDNMGAIGWGKTTIATNDPDVYTYLTVGATGFKNGIYADTNGLYAVINGTAIPYDSWGSDPLYTQGDFQDSVIDRLATPPSGVNGERYLIIATASGDWTGHEDEITEYQDGWVFITESEGMMTWVEDEDVYYVYSGSAWAEFSTGVDNINDIGDIVISGTPANNELLAYDTGGDWINQTAAEAGLATVTTVALLASDNIFTGMQYINNNTDASLTDDDASLVIGTKGGIHIEIDNNEILAKTDTTTAGTLNLQVDGGVVQIGATADLRVSKLTASYLVETDGSKNLVSVAPSDVYDKLFGTSTGQVAEGDHDHDSRYPQDGTYYLYLPAVSWQFGTMHNDADYPAFNDNKG